MRISTVLLIMCLTTAGEGLAQGAHPKTFTTPLAGKAVLSEVEDKYSADVYNLEMPEPDGDADQEKLEEVKRYIAGHYPHKTHRSAAKATSIQPPFVVRSFVADTLPGVPPDNYMAVSNGGKAVSVMNGYVAVHDGLSGQMLYRKSLYNFSLAVGLSNNQNPNNYRYDPKIIYDPEADRYICIMLNGTDADNWIVVAFSQTNQPEGAWAFYKFYGDYMADTTWFDYPSISITHDELFFTGNKIKYGQSWQAGFTRSVIYQVKKQQGYNSDPSLTYRIWDSIAYNGQQVRNLYPVKGGASISGPEQYLLSNRNFDVQNDSIFLIKVPDTIGAPDSTLTLVPLQSDLAYGVPPSARQKPGFDSLATNDGRILGGYREGSEIQFVSTTLNTGNGASAVYHGKITNITTTPSVHGAIFSIDTLDLGYPNLSYAGNFGGVNNSIISFDYSGPATWAGMGAIYFDGSQYSDMLNIKSGDSAVKVITGLQRWGDYSGSQPVWNQPGAVWVEGIFGHKKQKYGNYMAKLAAPYMTTVQQQEPAGSSVGLYPNPAWQFTQVEFTLPADQLVRFVIFDINGRRVDQVMESPCRQGRNLVQFNVAPLAQGTYFIKGINARSEVLFSERFMRQ